MLVAPDRFISRFYFQLKQLMCTLHYKWFMKRKKFTFFPFHIQWQLGHILIRNWFLSFDNRTKSVFWLQNSSLCGRPISAHWDARYDCNIHIKRHVIILLVSIWSASIIQQNISATYLINRSRSGICYFNIDFIILFDASRNRSKSFIISV